MVQPAGLSTPEPSGKCGKTLWGGAVSLRVQARDTKGNLVVSADFGDDYWEEAFRTANSWMENNYLIVEFIRNSDETWECGGCGARILDLLAGECVLCGTKR
jgi:hypothetical protein